MSSRILFSRFNIYCLDCFPYLGLFQVPLSKLQQLTESGFKSQLAHKFQATFVSVNRQLLSSQVLHVRPILDGCFFYSAIFVPKKKEDFDRLKEPYQRCDLNNVLLNVSMREVRWDGGICYLGFYIIADGFRA